MVTQTYNRKVLCKIKYCEREIIIREKDYEGMTSKYLILLVETAEMLLGSSSSKKSLFLILKKQYQYM